MRQIKDSLASFVFAMLAWLAPAAVCPAADLNLIPWPKTIQVEQGNLELTRDSRIVAQDAALLPLANVLASEFLLVAGIAPASGILTPRNCKVCKLFSKGCGTDASSKP